jgi:putative ABC transport system ATP-binding protein
MLQVSDLRFQYGDAGFALSIDALELTAGESVALVGPSGSGKTTLLHLVAGILTPDTGHIRVNREDLGALDDAARRAFRIRYGNGLMLQVSGLHFQYGDAGFALSIDALELSAGESVALVGPSGSGKTTLLHLAAGILTPDAGRMCVNGENLAALSDEARRAFRVRQIGLVFQEFELLEYLSVLDNILLPYRIHPALRLDAVARRRARTLADRLGIGDKLGRLPNSLSQGERQRVAVCRALVTGPPLLLADEPTGNLDPVNKQRVLDTLFELAAESGATILTVTHDQELLPYFGRVIDFKGFQQSPEVAS